LAAGRADGLTESGRAPARDRELRGGIAGGRGLRPAVFCIERFAHGGKFRAVSDPTEKAKAAATRYWEESDKSAARFADALYIYHRELLAEGRPAQIAEGRPAQIAEGWHGVVTVGELLDRLSEIDRDLPVALSGCGSRYYSKMEGTAAPERVVVTEHTVVHRRDPMADRGREALFCVISGSDHEAWPPCASCEGRDEGFHTRAGAACESCWIAAGKPA
jgi:hypothetical protein